jgi:hypothetical protein
MDPCKDDVVIDFGFEAGKKTPCARSFSNDKLFTDRTSGSRCSVRLVGGRMPVLEKNLFRLAMGQPGVALFVGGMPEPSPGEARLAKLGDAE